MLAKHVKQLLWWHRLQTVNHVSFRCHFDGAAEHLAKLCEEIMTYQTPSLFAGVPDDDDAIGGENHEPVPPEPAA